MAAALLGAIALASACSAKPSQCGPAPSRQGSIDLPENLAAGRLRTVNRDTPVRLGTAVRLTAAPGIGVAWIGGTDFADGTIEADLCGRDVPSQSFVGVAFHRKDDRTFEVVYVRPFNFRASDPDRRQHAVQYAAEPDYDFARLRAKFPKEFEHAVDPSLLPTAWIPLRIVVHDGRVRVFVGDGKASALDVRELRTSPRGQVGLYVDNGSDAVFANVRIGRD